MARICLVQKRCKVPQDCAFYNGKGPVLVRAVLVRSPTFAAIHVHVAVRSAIPFRLRGCSRWIKKARFMRVRGYDGYFVCIAGGQVRIDEDEDVG